MGENSEALAGLPWLAQVRVYGGRCWHAASIVELVARISRRSFTLSHQFLEHILSRAQSAENRGALRARLGTVSIPIFSVQPRQPHRQTSSFIAQKRVKRSSLPVQPGDISAHFARSWRVCARERDTLCFAHTGLWQAWEPVVSESQMWPSLGAPVDIVGVRRRSYSGIPPPMCQSCFMTTCI